MFSPRKRNQENQENTTPLKGKKGECIVCSKKGSDLRIIQSEAGFQRGLSRMIKEHVGIVVQGGYLCRSCEEKLVTIDKKILHIKALYADNASSKKRCSKLTPEKTCLTKHGPTTNRNPKGSPFGCKSAVGELKSSTLPITPSTTHSHFAKKKLFQKPDPASSAPLVHHWRRIAPRGGIQTTISPSNPLLTPSVHDHGYSLSPTAPPASPSITHLANQLQNLQSESTYTDDVIMRNEMAVNELKRRKQGYVSVLMTNTKEHAYDMLANFTWESLSIELVEKFPQLCQILVCIMLQKCDQGNTSSLASIVPRLGLIYSLVVQCRIPELSLVQRLMSTILADSLSPVQVYDRLSKPGVCLSYKNTGQLIERFRGNFDVKLIEGIKSGKHLRIVGDNINFYVGVRDERKIHHGRMMHYFGSALLLRELSFPELPAEGPQLQLHEIGAALFLPEVTEINGLVEDYSYLAMKVASRHIPYFSFLRKDLPSHLVDKYSKKVLKKTTVIPLAAVPRNEQYYGDVVEIMRDYVRVLREAFLKAGIPVNLIPRIHIGGDQLTRERFSGAKRLLIGRQNEPEGFEILSPISPEFFHLSMNFLQVPFKQLWNDRSSAELGTLKSAQTRLQLQSVKPSVKDAYSADKEFFTSFVDAHIIELACTHFDMIDAGTEPRRNACDGLPSYDWAKEQFSCMIRENVGTFVHGKTGQDVQGQQQYQQGPEDLQHGPQDEHGPAFQQAFMIDLPDGRRLRVIIRPAPLVQPAPRQSDKVQHYGSLVLELGLLFKNLTECIKVPNRARMIRTLKVIMVLLKAHNHLSKYADEILRLLVHQLAILSEREAHLMFYSLFVNTKGKIDSNIPCDLQMEYIVRVCKKHIKHMFSNKTEKNISKKTGALAAVNDIIQNYDDVSEVSQRTKHHSTMSKEADEISMIQDLREVRPFETHANRTHAHFPQVQDSLLGHLNYNSCLQWLSRNSVKHATSLGN